MGDKLNIFLDDLDALLLRLLQLPIAFQMLLWFVIAGLFWWSFLFLLRIKFKSLEKKAKIIWFTIGVVCSLLIASGVIIDKKNKLIEDEMTELMHRKQSPEVIKIAEAVVMINSVNLIDNKSNIGDEKTEAIYSQDGIQAIQMTFTSPDVVAFLASVDLQKFDIVLDTLISTKTKTSDFVKGYNAEIAVNGEAGETPGITAPLGQWIGNYIVNGIPILLKDSEKRPNIYFNKNSKAHYSNGKEIITHTTPEMYNCIWGRFDLIQHGKIDIDPRDRTKNNPYPRTIIGIDSTGYRVFLMIVDGRKPGYSAGMTMEECGRILLKYGAYSAMACDQGGSTTMYINGLGIVNRPADGRERAVYTHFGLKRKN